MVITNIYQYINNLFANEYANIMINLNKKNDL